ncbi:hypothetical protein IC582_015674 [Cucumis melo]
MFTHFFSLNFRFANTIFLIVSLMKITTWSFYIYVISFGRVPHSLRIRAAKDCITWEDHKVSFSVMSQSLVFSPIIFTFLRFCFISFFVLKI